MPYDPGDILPDDEAIVRRVKKKWIVGAVVQLEAFRPKKYDDGTFEEGVSVDVRALLEAPIGNDNWSNHPTNQYGTVGLTCSPANQSGYPVTFDGKSASHCEIRGSMEELYEDDFALKKMASASEILHNPWAK